MTKRRKKRKKSSTKSKQLYQFVAAIEGHGVGYVWAKDEKEAVKIVANQDAPKPQIKAFEITGIKNLKKV